MKTIVADLEATKLPDSCAQFRFSFAQQRWVPHSWSSSIAPWVGNHEPIGAHAPPAPPQVAGCPTLATPLFLSLGWETTNPLARERRLPHRRWLCAPSMEQLYRAMGGKPRISTVPVYRSATLFNIASARTRSPSVSTPIVSRGAAAT